MPGDTDQDVAISRHQAIHVDVLADEDISRFDMVWAAAGLPDAVFEIAVRDLERLSGARSASIAASPGME